MVYLFHESKMCSVTTFTVNSLYIWWNSNAIFTLCQYTLSNVWHSNYFEFWISKG